MSPRGGGTMALLAEAGRPERVTPLDSNGFSASERKILAMLEKALSSQGDGSVNLQVFLGTREIEDIVDVRLDGKSTQAGRSNFYSRPVI